MHNKDNSPRIPEGKLVRTVDALDVTNILFTLPHGTVLKVVEKTTILGEGEETTSERTMSPRTAFAYFAKKHPYGKEKSEGTFSSSEMDGKNMCEINFTSYVDRRWLFSSTTNIRYTLNLSKSETKREESLAAS